MAIKHSRGFSLIEMVVYIAILVFMLIIISEVVFSVSRNNRVIKAVRTVELSAVGALERMNREIRNADSIDTAASSFGVSPGVLSLDGEDDAGVAYSVEFYLSDGRVRVRENGIEAGALTQASSTVTTLIFSRFSATTTEGVRIEMAVESGTSTAYRSETFYSTVLIR
jgi:type II secretory pathway pseudopilin PulG